jgi:hypothetical protein
MYILLMRSQGRKLAVFQGFIPCQTLRGARGREYLLIHKILRGCLQSIK